jgi:hypothetical protein
MAVSLAKIIDGNPAISDRLASERIVICPKCEQATVSPT